MLRWVLRTFTTRNSVTTLQDVNVRRNKGYTFAGDKKTEYVTELTENLSLICYRQKMKDNFIDFWNEADKAWNEMDEKEIWLWRRRE
jgi:hypothetical protein